MTDADGGGDELEVELHDIANDEFFLDPWTPAFHIDHRMTWRTCRRCGAVVADEPELNDRHVDWHATNE